MDLNLTACFRVYEKTFNNIATALKINNPDNTYLCAPLTLRTLVIFKLNLILFEYRENLDKKREVLIGRNALTHYLFNKKGITFTEAKNISLNDAVIILWNEINSYEIPENIINHIRNHSDNYHHTDNDISKFKKDYPSYIDEEWDPNYADEELRK
ncbi:hypothetical protein OHJ28_22120 [Dickeya fangzhongdai]|uniref:ECs1072 family phage-associated protein n=1 Tax=Dickeya fangzhongdai TaxID=1778540 RepID=UPI0033076667